MIRIDLEPVPLHQQIISSTHKSEPCFELTKAKSGAIDHYAYDVANGQILITPFSGFPTTVTYDGAGNRQVENNNGALATYTWDGQNRMTQVTSPTTTQTYAYRADGKRYQRSGTGLAAT